MGAKPAGKASEFSRRLVARIEELRDDAGMTNTQLIEKSGLRTTYYYARLRGDASFTTNDVDKLARALGISGEDVFTTATTSLITVSGPELARRLRFLTENAAASGAPVDQDALIAKIADRYEHFDAARWDALFEGREEIRVPEPVLAGIAEFFTVPDGYLAAPVGDELVEQVEAQAELAAALRARGASTVAARSLGELPPAQLRELARALRSPAEPEDD